MSRVIGGRWILVLGLGFCLSGQTRAADNEYRDYDITVNGKDSGKSQITITRQADGALVMTGQAAARIPGLIPYRFSNQTSEWWKNGKLFSLKASTDDNGKRTEVSATAEGNVLRLRVNNQDRTARGDAWPSSFWKLPDAKYHNKDIPVLELDTGKEFMGHLQYVGTEQKTVAGQPQNCYHFRVIGGPSPTDLWFDRYYLLVRSEFTDTGKRIAVQITNIRR